MDLKKIIKGASDPEKVESKDADLVQGAKDLKDQRTISGPGKASDYEEVK